MDEDVDVDVDVDALCKMLCTQNDKVHMGDGDDREEESERGRISRGFFLLLLRSIIVVIMAASLFVATEPRNRPKRLHCFPATSRSKQRATVERESRRERERETRRRRRSRRKRRKQS